MLHTLKAAALVCSLLFLSTAQAAGKHPTQPPAPAVAEPAPAGKLPETATPLYYQLHFNIDPAKARFTADAVLTVQLEQAADHLWLHGRALKVTSLTLTDAAAKTTPAHYRQLSADGAARVDFGRRLAPQTLSLHFVYSAAFNTSLEGLYKVQRGGEAYAMTQMEAVAARWAFPCFDEPRFKTPFAFSMTIPAALVGVANTRQIGEERLDGGKSKTLTFAPTEKLPTYLLAFAVGPWEVSETTILPPNRWRAVPIPLRVLGPRGSGAGFGYVLKTVPAMVNALEDYFGIAYAFDKLDLLAAPDFAAGAMENAGLVTFLDSVLLVDEGSPLQARRSYTEVTVHELAHQWFGDLVTPQWWDDIWLNEAFANWMASRITGQLHPEWHSELQQLHDTQDAMAKDSIVSARRIREPVNSVADIGSAFDGITYDKGAAVLTMLESWAGAEKFQQGIREHMFAHFFGTANADDLLDALQKSSARGSVFSAAARSFLDQPGVPLLEVTPACQDGRGSIELAQSRYLPLGSQGAAPGKGWSIPACLKIGHADGSIENRCALMSTPTEHIDLATCPAWVLPNAAARGYYRFTLPPAQLRALGAALPQLSPLEQLAYNDAVAASFETGRAGVEEVLTALAASATSTLPAVVTSLWKELEFLRAHLLDAAGTEALRQRLAGIYAPALARLGRLPRAGETDDDLALRAELYKTMGVSWALPEFRAPLLAQGEALLAASAKGRLALSTVPSDMRAAVLAVLLQEQGASFLPRVLAELDANSGPQDRAALIFGLANVTDPALLPAVRALTLDKSLHFREMVSLLRTHAAQPANTPGFFAWYLSRLPELRQHFNTSNIERLPRYAATGMCSAAEATALSAAFTPLLPGIEGGERALRQQLETIQLCAALKAAHAGSWPVATRK